jgi:hypothetical protein
MGERSNLCQNASIAKKSLLFVIQKPLKPVESQEEKYAALVQYQNEDGKQKLN